MSIRFYAPSAIALKSAPTGNPDARTVTASKPFTDALTLKQRVLPTIQQSTPGGLHLSGFQVYAVYMTRLTTAEKILRVAHRLFDRKGAEAVTMRRVADAVGITPMAIYRHFPTREALLKRLSDDSFNAVAHEWEARRAHSPDVLTRLTALVEPYLDYALAHPHLFDHAFSVRRDDARRYPEDFRAGLSPTFNVALDAVIEGMAQGVLKQDDPYDVTMAIWAQQHGLIALYRAERFSFDEAQFRAFYAQSLRRLIDGIKA
ncbi:TetR family transcriptional regulator [Luteibacter rhizovicinus]|uniref:TetR family transcriptional regulator n=1 Tax=Luteibacter rhizovicinus TaxID=242606 RepID=A0A4R3YTQ1_9GAMM|nr:TetR/AcrR family transcriptional regulator [Luteibacter rhizovicinus]TCV96425.1 TetR family transcriptional regulator [Luteibacter rhizovicinus]